jgi:hypothetical protein
MGPKGQQEAQLGRKCLAQPEERNCLGCSSERSSQKRELKYYPYHPPTHTETPKTRTQTHTHAHTHTQEHASTQNLNTDRHRHEHKYTQAHSQTHRDTHTQSSGVNHSRGKNVTNFYKPQNYHQPHPHPSIKIPAVNRSNQCLSQANHCSCGCASPCSSRRPLISECGSVRDFCAQLTDSSPCIC